MSQRRREFKRRATAVRTLAALLVTAACRHGHDSAPVADSDVALAAVASGLDGALDLTAPPGDTRRLFVAEQPGRIRVVRDGALLDPPFLDLRGAVSTGSEQGLLGIAFHPGYATNGRFFVEYTDGSGDTQVVGYRVSADPDVADVSSAATILSVAQPFANHNGGGLAFGPDGFLYVALGDGGSEGDPQGHGQSTDDLLGSILRLDVDSASPYAIPPSNPFVSTPGARGELWNVGLRNPFRFSFDRGGGDLYVGDVGQDEREEIDVARAGEGGQNYGWKIMEGTTCFGAPSCDQSGLTLPVLDYDHSGGACAVIGGYVYRGAAIAGLAGTYIYGDLCARFVRSFRFDGGASDRREWPALSPPDAIRSFGEDAAGELYVLTGSTVFRIVPAQP